MFLAYVQVVDVFSPTGLLGQTVLQLKKRVPNRF